MDRVESDMPTQRTIETLVELSIDSFNVIAWDLTKLLDMLAAVSCSTFNLPKTKRQGTSFFFQKKDPQTGHVAIDVLQSQLIILKVLSITMASRWTRLSSSVDDDRSNLGPGSTWEEPPPLDDSCVKYILSVMVIFMRQTAKPDVPLMVDTRSTDTSFRDFEDRVNIKAAVKSMPQPPLPSAEASLRNRPSANSVLSGKLSIRSTSHIAAANTQYENSPALLLSSSLAVNDLISKYVGRIIFHISASNWRVVFDRLLTKINQIATSRLELTPDSAELQLMSYSVLDRVRLVLLLNRACIKSMLFFYFFLLNR